MRPGARYSAPFSLLWLKSALIWTHPPVYYRLYTKDGPLESNNPIYSNDNFISRIVSLSVRPPHTASSLMRYLCKIEGLALQNCILFQSLSEITALDDSIHLSLQGTTGPGASELDPMALVVDERAVERRSKVTSAVQPRELLERDYEQRYGAALLCVTRKSTSRIFSVLSCLRRWWWDCQKVFQLRREQSFFGPYQHSFCAPASHCFFLKKSHYQIRRCIRPQCSAIWGWGQRVCHEWQWCVHLPLWYVPRIYRRPTNSNYIWIGDDKWWVSMEPRDSEVLIRFSWQRGSERDPDTRAERSIGTDRERIWRSKPNTRAWACWGERGMEKGERDIWARDKRSPILATSTSRTRVETSKSLNGALPALTWHKYSLRRSQRNSKQRPVVVSDNGSCSKLF